MKQKTKSIIILIGITCLITLLFIFLLAVKSFMAVTPALVIAFSIISILMGIVVGLLIVAIIEIIIFGK